MVLCACRYWSWFSMELFKSAWSFKFLPPWTLSFRGAGLLRRTPAWPEKDDNRKSPKRVANDAKENMEHLISLGLSSTRRRRRLEKREDSWFLLRKFGIRCRVWDVMQPFSSLGFLGISCHRQLQTEKERNEIKEVELQKQETLSCRRSFSHLLVGFLPWLEKGISEWFCMPLTPFCEISRKFQARYLRTMAARKSIQDFHLSWIEMDSSRSFLWEGGMLAFSYKPHSKHFKTLPKDCRKLAQVSLGQRQWATGKDCEGGGMVGQRKS